jgi:hypothetical protein
MHLVKPGLRHQDLEGPSFRFSWKIKKLCLIDFFVFESWQTAEELWLIPPLKTPRSCVEYSRLRHLSSNGQTAY